MFDFETRNFYNIIYVACSENNWFWWKDYHSYPFPLNNIQLKNDSQEEKHEKY